MRYYSVLMSKRNSVIRIDVQADDAVIAIDNAITTIGDTKREWTIEEVRPLPHFISVKQER
jgi:hypothetical protein